MSNIQRYTLPIVFFAGVVVIFGCPDSKTAETGKDAAVVKEAGETGAVEQWAEETGKKAADKLQQPIEQAREAKKDMDSRLVDMTDKLNKQAQALAE